MKMTKPARSLNRLYRWMGRLYRWLTKVAPFVTFGIWVARVLHVLITRLW